MNCRILTACTTVHHNSYYWNCQEWDTGQQKCGQKKVLILSISQWMPPSWSMFSSVQSLSHVWLFETPWTAARQASLSITNSQSLLKLVSIKSVMPSNYLILCHPLLLLPSIFPSIRVFSNKSVLCIRWPKYWSFSFSISPSNAYSGLISFRIDWFDYAWGDYKTHVAIFLSFFSERESCIRG